MAYDDSGELPIASDPSEENIYNLGGYSFELEVQNVHEPGEPDVVSVFAICRSPDGSRQTQAMDFSPGTNVTGWYVEANETEASVYVHTLDDTEPLDISPIPYPVPESTGGSWTDYRDRWTYTFEGFSFLYASGRNFCGIVASAEPGVKATITEYNHRTGSTTVTEHKALMTYTHGGKQVYYIESITDLSGVGVTPTGLPKYNFRQVDEKKVAWMIVYGETAGEEEEHLVGRFAIDLREADGGPDGDWDEPGSDGPPNKTLYVTVVGASAGMHDPLIFPTENRAIKGYGFGGDGGHGGGGGAGASTVIIYDFATSKADEVVQEAITKLPGNGSGGGKGGKGGDGCILIFY